MRKLCCYLNGQLCKPWLRLTKACGMECGHGIAFVDARCTSTVLVPLCTVVAHLGCPFIRMPHHAMRMPFHHKKDICNIVEHVRQHACMPYFVRTVLNSVSFPLAHARLHTSTKKFGMTAENTAPTRGRGGSLSRQSVVRACQPGRHMSFTSSPQPEEAKQKDYSKLQSKTQEEIQGERPKAISNMIHLAKRIKGKGQKPFQISI